MNRHQKLSFQKKKNGFYKGTTGYSVLITRVISCGEPVTTENVEILLSQSVLPPYKYSDFNFKTYPADSQSLITKAGLSVYEKSMGCIQIRNDAVPYHSQENKQAEHTTIVFDQRMFNWPCDSSHMPYVGHCFTQWLQTILQHEYINFASQYIRKQEWAWFRLNAFLEDPATINSVYSACWHSIREMIPMILQKAATPDVYRPQKTDYANINWGESHLSNHIPYIHQPYPPGFPCNAENAQRDCNYNSLTDYTIKPVDASYQLLDEIVQKLTESEIDPFNATTNDRNKEKSKEVIEEQEQAKVKNMNEEQEQAKDIDREPNQKHETEKNWADEVEEEELQKKREDELRANRPPLSYAEMVKKNRVEVTEGFPRRDTNLEVRKKLQEIAQQNRACSAMNCVYYN